MTENNNARKVTGDKDILAGRNIRARRTILGLSQEDVADELGISFQQIQKYERGLNRISAGSLHTVATMFGMRMDRFFEEEPEEFTPQSMGLMKDFNRLSSKEQAAVIALVKGLANGKDD